MAFKTDPLQAMTLKDHLILHGKWRSRAIRAIHDLRAWLRNAGKATPQTDECLRAALATLAADNYRVAIAGAAKRGKTDLINALFFADFGRRLLPTTDTNSLCPVEIRWDAADGDACLRLLPIESRRESDDLYELKGTLSDWVRLPLHPQEPEQIRATLAEIHRTRPMSRLQAKSLGLADLAAEGAPTAYREGQPEVPCWRYAILNFPHPLLKKGLVLLDLPGLNAMNADATLYRQVLRPLDAVLLTIAADEGVEAEDLTLWQSYFEPHEARPEQLLVALTRNDLLARDEAQRGALLDRLRRNTAAALGVDLEVVHTVSARDGLTAKIADKPAKLQSSGMDILESILGTKLTIQRRVHCRTAIDSSAGPLIRDGLAALNNETVGTATRIRQLKELQVHSDELATRLLNRARQDEQNYVDSVRLVQIGQRTIHERAARWLRLLDADGFDRLGELARGRMQGCWTSHGMRRNMRALIDELRYVVAQTGPEASALRRQIDMTYALLQQEIGLNAAPPKVFNPVAYRTEMDLLHAETMRSLASGIFLLNSRGKAIDLFERRYLQRAKALIESLRQDWQAWTAKALEPAAVEVEHRKNAAEQRLMHFQRFKHTREDARAERTELERKRVRLAKQLTLLRNIRNALDYEPAANGAGGSAPYLITDSGQRVHHSG